MIIKSIDETIKMNLHLKGLNYYIFEDKNLFISAMESLEHKNCLYNYYDSDCDLLNKKEIRFINFDSLNISSLKDLSKTSEVSKYIQNICLENEILFPNFESIRENTKDLESNSGFKGLEKKLTYGVEQNVSLNINPITIGNINKLLDISYDDISYLKFIVLNVLLNEYSGKRIIIYASTKFDSTFKFWYEKVCKLYNFELIIDVGYNHNCNKHLYFLKPNTENFEKLEVDNIEQYALACLIKDSCYLSYQSVIVQKIAQFIKDSSSSTYFLQINFTIFMILILPK